jgi:hypothetical protein
MIHLIVAILLLLAGCLLQILPVRFFAPWGSYPVARREIARIPILIIGATQLWVGLMDVIQNDTPRIVIFDVSIGVVLVALLYAVWKCNRRR